MRLDLSEVIKMNTKNIGIDNIDKLDFIGNRNKNRFKAVGLTQTQVTKNLSDIEVANIKENNLKVFSNHDFNLNVKPDNFVKFDENDISNYINIGNTKEKYKDLLINNMTDELIDELLYEIGNENTSKRGLRRKNSADKLYDYTFRSIPKNYIPLIKNNMVISGYNKNDDNKYQYLVSYRKNDTHNICKFSHITYNGYVQIRSQQQYDLAEKIFDCNFNNETKQIYFDFLTNNGLCSSKYAINLISDNNKEAINKILRTRNIKFNTGFSKVITIDCDFDNDDLGGIRKEFVFNILRNFKYVIAENKENKRNHFSIVLFLSDFRNIEFVSRIRDMFKIAGICDYGHQTVFGKNIFNTELYNIYYNKEGKHIDENFKEFENSVIGKCCNVNEEWLQHLGVELNDNVNIKIHEMALLNDKNKNSIKLNLIDFNNSNEFINFAYKNKLRFNNKKFNNVTIVEKDDEYQYESKDGKIIKKKKERIIESIGYEELCRDLKIQKIKSINDLLNRTIIFQNQHRKRNCKYFGNMLGSYFKLGLSLKQVLYIFDKTVKVMYNDKDKHDDKEVIKAVIEGYNTRRKPGRIIHTAENGKTYDEVQILCGNVVANSRSTMKTMKNILEEAIHFKNINEDIVNTKRIINKNHRRYKEFIEDICNLIYYSKINENTKIEIYNYMFNWLCNHTLIKAFDTFSLRINESCPYMFNFEQEFVNFFNNYVTECLENLKIEEIEIVENNGDSIINKIFKQTKIVTQTITMKTFLMLRDIGRENYKPQITLQLV